MNAFAIEFANTTYAVRGKVHDDIATPAALAAFLKLDALTDAEFATFRELREAIRAGDNDVINRASAVAPRWPELVGDTIVERDDSPPAQSALAAIARDAITVLSGGNVRRCEAPGCVLLFIKEHPRQEWCSPVCGNRARAARHYQRHR